MDFIHDTEDIERTIAAITTAPGNAGVAIIRISGKEALVIANRLFSGPILCYASHTVHFGAIMDEGEKIDEGLALVMLSPKSYTGEDTVELHCHGGVIITGKVLAAALKAGARLAKPGEFTCRAYLNGKMDLAQAEAVQQLISAKNEEALAQAKLQLEGRLSKEVAAHQKELTHIAAILEAWVDFPEDGLEFASFDEVIRRLLEVQTSIDKLIATYHDGKLLKDGISLCLAGRPNVGKSSLMNALVGFERAIVSSIAGTTRDLVEDDLRIASLTFRVTDTAGIRESCHAIEEEGVRRSKLAMERSDLILLVLNANEGVMEEDKTLISICPPEKTVIAWNKVDLPHNPFLEHAYPVSAKTGAGIDTIKKALEQTALQGGIPSKEEMVLTNARHKDALNKASMHIRHVVEGLQNNTSAEFLTYDLCASLQQLGKIIGRNISEDILDAVFSTFCIGK